MSSRTVRLYLLSGLLFVGSGLASGSLAWSYLYASSIDEKPEGGYRIVRTADGFYPEKLTIVLGESVTFVADVGEQYWPASNVHPSHTIYPEFDPGRPLEPHEVWTFTFERAGTWRFHDHLAANFEGVITVLDASGSAPRQPVRVSDCERVTSQEKQGCWDNLLAHVMRAEGFKEAFALFVRLYETEPDVPKACHGWGHVLGKVAYELYRSGERFDLPSEASYCGYGFYHGFLEELVGETGDAKSAYQFCQTMRSQGFRDGIAYDNCIHGIGHGGAASIIEEPIMWGKYEAAIARGASLCRSFTDDPLELRNCFDGVFNEMVLALWSGEYGLSTERDLDRGDPLALCHAQPRELRTSCYFEYMGIFEHLFDGDLAHASSFVVADIPDTSDAKIAIRKLAADFMQSAIVRDSFAPEISACEALEDTLEVECFNGIGIGFIAHGEPNREYVKALAFCGSNLLPERHVSTCFERMLWYFRETYDADIFADVCTHTPPAYQTLCSP